MWVELVLVLDASTAGAMGNKQGIGPASILIALRRSVAHEPERRARARQGSA